MPTLESGLPFRFASSSILSRSSIERQMQQASSHHHVATEGVLSPNHKQMQQHRSWLEHQGCRELAWWVLPALPWCPWRLHLGWVPTPMTSCCSKAHAGAGRPLWFWVWTCQAGWPCPWICTIPWLTWAFPSPRLLRSCWDPLIPHAHQWSGAGKWGIACWTHICWGSASILLPGRVQGLSGVGNRALAGSVQRWVHHPCGKEHLLGLSESHSYAIGSAQMHLKCQKKICWSNSTQMVW